MPAVYLNIFFCFEPYSERAVTTAKRQQPIQGDNKKALEWYQRALDGNKAALGKRHKGDSTLDSVSLYLHGHYMYQN